MQSKTRHCDFCWHNPKLTINIRQGKFTIYF
jgi:hypothetical protein